MYDYEKLVLRPVDDVNVKIDVNLIPEYQRRKLAEFSLELTKEVFSRPGEAERYQAWLQDRRKEAAGE